MVGDEAADRRTDGRSEDHGHAVHRHRHAPPARRERIDEDGLLAGSQAPAAKALKHAKEHKLIPIVGARPHRREPSVKAATQYMLEALSTEPIAGPTKSGATPPRSR